MSVRETGRVGAAIAIVALLLGLVAVRLVYLTFVRGPALAGGANRQHRGVARLDAQRGSIFDRHGDPLAVTVTAGAVGLHPALLPADPPVTELCDVLGVTRAEWNRSANRDVSFTWLKRPVSVAQMEAVEALGVRGVRVEAAGRRLYPRGRLAASLIGFAGVDLQGLEGVERVYDRNLRSGAQKIGVERDGRGRLRFTDGALPRARRGVDVELTIDSALQFAAEQALDRQVSETGAAAGVAVMLDPHTGEILALAQSPGFDLNHYAEAPRSVRRNRAITDVYEPGSTLKAMLAAAVLETDDSMRDRTFYCENGHYRIGRNVVHDHHGYGDVSFDQVFGVSSNICAAKLGAWLGANRLDGFLRRFGFGALTGIDLDGEQPGIMRPGATWKPIELATISFGQGIAVTPLQMASAFAVIANGGNLVRPYVVRRILDVDGTVLQETVPTVVRAGVLRPEVALAAAQVLEKVVLPGGTGWRAAVQGIRVAGKTGTAQKVENGRYGRGRIASFAGFYPADAPRVVLLVVIDEPKTSQWGGMVAAPAFAEIAEASLDRLGLRRRPLDDLVIQPASLEQPLDFERAHDRGGWIGLSLREALARARAEEIPVAVSGSGYVVRQVPPTGIPLAAGQRLRLELSGGDA